MMNSPKGRIIFENRYEIIEWITNQIGHAAAYDDTSSRLDDAIRLRKELKYDTK